jgi:acyl-CoA thioesterase-1
MSGSFSRVGLIVLAAVAVSSLVRPAEGAEPAKRNPKPVKANPVMQPIEDDPALPRVLLIGDSISIGYTLPVRKLLEGKANVHRPLTNCGPTTRGLEQIDAWLGEKPWDVIHFNWGLHDLKYLGPEGQNLADPQAAGSRQQVPPADYESNLRKLVQRLKKTGAALIWCSTTPVPEGAQGRVPGDAAKYNDIAARVMKDEGVAIDDLYAFAKPRLAQIQLPANVHFTPDGSAALAGEVARAIAAALKE